MAINPAATNTHGRGGLLWSQERIFLSASCGSIFRPFFTQDLAHDLFEFSAKCFGQNCRGLAHLSK